MSTTPMLRCLPAHLARAALVLFTLCTLAGLGRSAAQDPLLPPTNGPRRLDPTSIDGHGAGMHALVGGTIHPRPGEVIDKGTVLIRDGVIEAVRAATPQDLDRSALIGYQVHDCTGLHLYAGFIDPFVEVDAPRPDVNAPGSHWNPTVTPQRSALDGSASGVGRAFGNPPVDDATGQTLRSMGFVAAGLSPRGGIFRGAGAAVSLARPTGDLSAAPVPVYVPRAYQTVGFDQSRDGDRQPDDERWTDYPSSGMGTIALIRQTLIDAKWQAEMVRDGYRAAGESCLDQLATAADGKGKALWFDTGDELEALRADTIAREFERPVVVVGSGREFRRLSAIKSSGRAMVVPLNFAERPRVTTQGEAESVELERMMMWEQGPTNPRRLAQAGVEFALTTSKVPDKLGGRAGFAEKLRTAVKHGLTADQALTALTVTPAKLLGVQDRLGTLEKGKIASIVLSDKALFQDKADRGEEKAEKTKGEASDTDGKAAASENASDAKDAVAKEDAQASKPADEEKSKGKTDHAMAKDKPARVMEVWIDGRRHEIIARPEVEIAGTWEIRFAMPKREEGEEAPAAPVQRFRAEIEIDDQVPPGITIRKVNLDKEVSAAPKETTDATKTGDAKAKSDDDTVTAKAREVRLDGNRLSFIFDHTPLGEPGFFRNAAVFERERRNDPTSELVMHATVERAGGGKAAFTARRIKPWEAIPEKRDEEAAPKLGSEAAEIAAIPSVLPVPFGAYGRIPNDQGKSADAMPAQENLAIVNTTVWTANEKNEVIEQGAVVISAGKITYVGPSASMPKLGSDYRILDLNGGSHVTPGIIDAHSHTGISKGVNEAGQAVTSEVRIQDVTDPDSISWYRQLAGGTTCVNSMHGSANPIGGQTQTNKIRWGVEHPNQMHMEGATPGIKFALGENVKQSNWGPRSVTRYPQTRMGVETLIRDRFQAAKEYMWTDEKRLKWELLRDNANWGRGYNDKAPETFTREQAKSVKERSPEAKDWPERKPRRDLELEALEEIIRGRRLIHCHSYRQDEILMLCRIADEFNFKIGTFQHGLECYKVADEVRTHALGASIFTDWWAYKVEVQDAIPQAGAILHDQGVSVSFNSDSDELARRLNYEAAKGIKYSGGQPGSEGGAPAARIDPATALRFVTINAATQLGIERRIGSLEVGKDADLVIWTVSPLSTYTRVVETYVDGRKMFSIEEDMQLRERIARERTRLIQKILAQEAREKGSPLMQAKQKDGEHESKGERPPASRRSLMERMKNQAADLRREQNLDLLRRGLDPRFSRCTDCGESSLGQW